MRAALAGDCERFLERTAKVQWGLMICVYCVSHAPALLQLDIRGYAGQNAKLLFWFVLVVQLSDVLQYVWGKTLGRHPVAPTVSPSKTAEGLVGGTLSASAIGALLWRVTPFRPMECRCHGLFTITAMGFAGVSWPGHQAGSRRQGPRLPDRGTRRSHGPHRFALLLRPDLSPGAVLPHRLRSPAILKRPGDYRRTLVCSDIQIMSLLFGELTLSGMS